MTRSHAHCCALETSSLPMRRFSEGCAVEVRCRHHQTLYITSSASWMSQSQQPMLLLIVISPSSSGSSWATQTAQDVPARLYARAAQSALHVLITITGVSYVTILLHTHCSCITNPFMGLLGAPNMVIGQCAGMHK